MSLTKLSNETWPDAWAEGSPLTNIIEDMYESIEDETTFHLGQVYENQAACMIRCKKCKGTHFNVGEGSYFTVIRCTTCLWEQPIHTG